MNNFQNNSARYKDEIDLRDLFITLWKRKTVIICLTLVFAIITAMVSMFVITPVYDSKLNIVISMPEEYSTRFGQYKLPITTNEQYINLITSNDVLINTIQDMEYDNQKITLEKLKKRILVVGSDVKANTIQNSFEVIVSADNPEESLKLAESLYENYIEFLDVMTKERAISYFINYFNVQNKSLANGLKNTKELLKKNEKLLAETSPTIANGQGNIEIQTQMTNVSNYVIPVDTANPNYIKIENDIVANKQQIYNIENSIEMNGQYLTELEIEEEAISKYYETGRAEKLESSVISVVETSVYLPSPPVAPTRKTSPSNTFNTLIGAVIGGAIGVMIALIKEYWIKKA
ncbi:MAG: Wzz/FepE/Etk N-terminal domain-containing protein [Sedimentibacter sp.]|uniref:Wzz/FepE/Etk N-terminal domain-containing protein n=1 Tax=Sedimentibacter sp. TaxID=1960295 RepID=UPI003158CE50